MKNNKLEIENVSQLIKWIFLFHSDFIFLKNCALQNLSQLKKGRISPKYITVAFTCQLPQRNSSIRFTY